MPGLPKSLTSLVAPTPAEKRGRDVVKALVRPLRMVFPPAPVTPGEAFDAQMKAALARFEAAFPR